MTVLSGAQRHARYLTNKELLEIANGGGHGGAHEARAELQRRELIRNMAALCLTLAVALLTGLALLATITTT